MKRYEIRGNCGCGQYVENLADAKRTANQLSAGCRLAVAFVFDRACTMNVYESRNGRGGSLAGGVRRPGRML